MKPPKRILSLVLASALFCSTIAEPVFAASATAVEEIVNESETTEVAIEPEMEPESEVPDTTENESSEEEPSEENSSEDQEEFLEPSDDTESEEQDSVDSEETEAEQQSETQKLEEENAAVIVDDSENEFENDKAEDEEDDYEWVTKSYVNPLYADVIDESDLNVPDENGVALYSAEGDCANLQEAAEYLRSKMVEKAGEVQIHFTEPYRATNDFLYDIPKEATEHTGVPNEGDYLLWQYAGWQGSYRQYIQNGASYVTDVVYTMTYYTTQEQEEQVSEKIDTLFQNWGMDEKTDYQKIQLIYDYICSNVTYDYKNLNDSSNRLKYTAYAALMNGTAVCQGYAILLYRMALEAGLDSRFISGLGYGEGHGWNIVEINGLYYDVDSTWDAGQALNYYYFLKCENNFLGHQRSDTYATDEFNQRYPMAAEDYTDESESGLPEAGFYSSKYANVNTLLNNEAVYSADQNKIYLAYDKTIQDGTYTAQGITLKTNETKSVTAEKISGAAQNKEIWCITVDKRCKNDFQLPVEITYTNAEGTSQKVEKSIQMIRGAGLSECEIQLTAETCYADGTEQKPGVMISYNGKTFAEGTDYKLTYKNNKNPGTATVTITGIGLCQGKTKKYFKIIVKDGIYYNAEQDFWYYYKDGIGYSYTGFAQDGDRKVYIIEGTIEDTYTGLAKDTDGTWYYVKAGVVDTSYTGLAQDTDEKWCYVKNGVYDTTFNGLVYYNGSWFYVQKGDLNWNYNGFVYHVDKKWYYVKGGKVNFGYTGIAQHTDGQWYYAKNGVIDWNYSNLIYYCGTWYYVQKGKINWNYSSLVQYNGTWYYVQGGKINWNYTNLVNYNGTWYYVCNGKLDWNYSNLVYYYGTWYYVQKGKINWNYSNLVQYNGTWYYVQKGKINWNYSNLVQYYGTWYYVQKGKINWNYTNLVYYYGTWYYVRNGKIDWNYTGNVKYDGRWYRVVKGVKK